MLTIDDALAHLGIDYADGQVTRNVARALQDAQSYLQSAVGADVFELLPDDSKVDRLVLAYLSDLYDERGTSAKAGNAKRDMIHSMELQLRLELARIRETAAEGAGL
jgi:hypothetical protein